MNYLDGNKKITCKIAGLVYRITYKYPSIEARFRDYIIDDKDVSPNEIIEITYTEDDIKEMEEQAQDEKADYIEYCCIYHKIVSRLPFQNRLLMHGAAIEYNGKGYMFSAPSGTGKSTHIAQWRKYLGDKVTVINGDKPELTFDEEKVYVNGAPWAGKERWQTNKTVPLEGICLIQRGTVNRIKRINPGEYLDFFFKQIYMNFEKDCIANTMDMFNRVTQRVPFYIMECDISEEAVKCSFEAMTGEEWRIK